MPVLKFNQYDYNCDSKKDKRGTLRVYCRRTETMKTRRVESMTREEFDLMIDKTETINLESTPNKHSYFVPVGDTGYQVDYFMSGLKSYTQFLTSIGKSQVKPPEAKNVVEDWDEVGLYWAVFDNEKDVRDYLYNKFKR